MAKSSQPRKAPLIYVAGPLFNSLEREYLERVAAALERAGYRTFLPHRDAGVLTEFSAERRRQIFQQDLDALEECDAIVAVLNGPDHDSGTSAELGFLFARGKPCFGLTDDIRWLNNLVWGLCDQGRQIAKDIETLAGQVDRKLRGSNVRSQTGH
jgi:nucleoside 2-deoxyribosyltransferase